MSGRTGRGELNRLLAFLAEVLPSLRIFRSAMLVNLSTAILAEDEKMWHGFRCYHGCRLESSGAVAGSFGSRNFKLSHYPWGQNIFPFFVTPFRPTIQSMSDDRQTEIQCLEKLRVRARKLMAANPQLSRDAAFAQACAAMPKTTNRYLFARSVLTQRGVPCQPRYKTTAICPVL